MSDDIITKPIEKELIGLKKYFENNKLVPNTEIFDRISQPIIDMPFEQPPIPDIKISVMDEIEKTNKKLSDINQNLQEQTNTLQSELQKLQYENKMVNAQLKTANITIDRQSDELEKLHSVNAKLKQTNEILEKNNKHSIRNAVLLSLSTGIILLLVEHWYDVYNFILHLINKG